MFREFAREISSFALSARVACFVSRNKRNRFVWFGSRRVEKSDPFKNCEIYELDSGAAIGQKYGFSVREYSRSTKRARIVFQLRPPKAHRSIGPVFLRVASREYNSTTCSTFNHQRHNVNILFERLTFWGQFILKGPKNLKIFNLNVRNKKNNNLPKKCHDLLKSDR